MNRIPTIAAVSAIAVLGFAGVSNAGLYSAAGPTGPGIDHVLKGYKSNNFSIINIGDLPAGDPVGEDYGTSGIHGKDVQKLQAAIEHNKVLSKKLRADGIELNSIVGVERAGDGSYIFYIS